MDDEQTEISDLQTAKVALHGALAMMRNLQDLNQRLKGDLQDAAHREKLVLKRELEAHADVTRIQTELNQLKVYYAAFESDLKVKARHEATQAEQLKWEHRMTKFQEAIDSLQKSRSLKEEELQRVRDDVTKKDKAISHLLEEGTASKMRMHGEWAVALERFETKHLEHLHAVGKAKEKEAQEQWAARMAHLQERCQNLEQELAEKDHLLTEKFHERIQKVLAQSKLREQSLWEQTQRLRETFEAESKQRFEQRLAVKDAEYKAALMASETRFLEQLQAAEQKRASQEKEFEAKTQNMRAAFEDDEAARVHVFDQKLTTLEMQWSAREKTLREEKDEALHALREKTRLPQKELQEEMETFRARLEQDYLNKEQLLRDSYVKLEAAGAERAQRRELEYLSALGSEKEKLLKIHTETLHAKLDEAEARHHQEYLEHERQIVHLRAGLEQAKTEAQMLQKQLQQADTEHASSAERAMALELEMARTKNASQAALTSLADQMREKQRAQLVDLQHQLQAKEIQMQEVENELRLARDHEEKLRSELAGNDSKLAGRYVELEKQLREKERELEVRERSLKEENAEKQAEMNRGASALEKRQAHVTEEEGILQQRQLQLGVLENQTQFLREQLTAALRYTEAIDGKTGGGTSQHMVDDWMFGFAHQIRNPLAIIRSTAEALADAKTAPMNPKALEAIIQSADGLTQRLAQFMEFSKPMEPVFKPVMLHEVMNAALAGIRDSLARATIKVNYTCEEQIPSVPGHALQFQDAITELLLNALEAMPSGGKLDIRLSYDVAHDQVILTLHDFGRGITTDHLKQIGKPFFTTKSGHAGLGLAHVKRVLHLYAGELKIESASTDGTQVRCYFRRKGWTR